MNIEREATQLSIDQAIDHANIKWKSEATAAVKILCLKGDPFTSEDVSNILDAKGIHTHELRALGSIMRQAAVDGLIRSVGWEYSKRKKANEYPKRIWEPVNRRKISA